MITFPWVFFDSFEVQHDRSSPRVEDVSASRNPGHGPSTKRPYDTGSKE